MTIGDAPQIKSIAQASQLDDDRLRTLELIVISIPITP